MKKPIEDILNKAIDIDETNLNTLPMTLNQMFEMGCFYQWAQQFNTEDEIDLSTMIEVPQTFEWIMNIEWVQDNEGDFVCWEDDING